MNEPDLSYKFLSTVMTILTEKMHISPAKKSAKIFEVKKNEDNPMLHSILDEFIAMILLGIVEGEKFEDETFGNITVIVTNPNLDPRGKQRILALNKNFVAYFE